MTDAAVVLLFCVAFVALNGLFAWPPSSRWWERRKRRLRTGRRGETPCRSACWRS